MRPGVRVVATEQGTDVAFPKRLLADHEEMVLDLRPNWIALVGPALVLVLVIVAEILLFCTSSRRRSWHGWRSWRGPSY
jgi:hypothetical protein